MLANATGFPFLGGGGRGNVMSCEYSSIVIVPDNLLSVAYMCS